MMPGCDLYSLGLCKLCLNKQGFGYLDHLVWCICSGAGIATVNQGSQSVLCAVCKACICTARPLAANCFLPLLLGRACNVMSTSRSHSGVHAQCTCKPVKHIVPGNVMVSMHMQCKGTRTCTCKARGTCTYTCKSTCNARGKMQIPVQV